MAIYIYTSSQNRDKLGTCNNIYVTNPPVIMWLVDPLNVLQNVYTILSKFIWLVGLTILKNISQWEGLSHILWKIKNVPNHQPVVVYPSNLKAKYLNNPVS